FRRRRRREEAQQGRDRNDAAKFLAHQNTLWISRAAAVQYPIVRRWTRRWYFFLGAWRWRRLSSGPHLRNRLASADLHHGCRDDPVHTGPLARRYSDFYLRAPAHGYARHRSGMVLGLL